MSPDGLSTLPDLPGLCPRFSRGAHVDRLRPARGGGAAESGLICDASSCDRDDVSGGPNVGAAGTDRISNLRGMPTASVSAPTSDDDLKQRVVCALTFYTPSVPACLGIPYTTSPSSHMSMMKSFHRKLAFRTKCCLLWLHF